MGLFSWFATTGRKSVAASHIQHYLEVSMRNGVFRGDPVAVANGMTEHACKRLPELPSTCKGYVLATAILTIAVREDGFPLHARDHFAMALDAMVEAAMKNEQTHSHEDQRILDAALDTLIAFREAVPIMSAIR